MRFFVDIEGDLGEIAVELEIGGCVLGDQAVPAVFDAVQAARGRAVRRFQIVADRAAVRYRRRARSRRF